MNHNDLAKFREQLNDIRLKLSGLREQAAKLTALADDERLIPEEVSGKLIDALKDYREKSALLQKTGKEISISLSDSLAEIEEELKTAEEKEKNAAELSLLLDYFRLTSEAEDVKQELEESKRKLHERLCTNADAAAAEYHPYKLTVKKVRESDSEISSGEFRELMDEIGYYPAFALIKSADNFRFDSSIDIAEFTEGIDLGGAKFDEEENESAKMLEADDSGDEPPLEKAKPSAVDASVSESRSDSETCADYDASGSEAGQAAESISDDEVTRPRWEHFDGYVGDVEVRFSDASSGTLGSSKFINSVKSKPAILLAFDIIAHQKLVDIRPADGGRSHFEIIPEDTVNYLIKHDYIMPVEVIAGEAVRSCLMLTTKGWAIYKKAEIAKFLKTSKNGTFIPEFIRMTTDGYTAKNVLKMLCIRDYFACRSKAAAAIYVLFPETDSLPIYAYSAREEDNMYPAILPAVFEKGCENEDLKKFSELINAWDDPREIHVIAESASDIAVLSGELQAEVGEEKREGVFFCANRDPDTLYDWNGNVVAPKSSKEAGDASGDVEEPEKKREEEAAGEQCAAEAAKGAVSATEISTLHTEKDPTSLAAELNEDERDHIKNCTEEMLAADKLYCASAYLAAAAESFPGFRSAYKCLAYALNDPLSGCTYSSENINAAFLSGEEPVPDSWLVASVIRNYFLDHSQYDYAIQGLYDTVKELSLFSVSPKLKNALRKLMEFKRNNNHGLDYYADYRTAGAASYEANQRELQKDAKQLYETHIVGVTRERANNERFIETKKLIFSRDGDLAEMMMMVAELKHTEVPLIKAYLQTTFLKDGAQFGISNLDSDKMDAFIDKEWENAQGKLFYKRNNIKLTGGLRQNLIAKIRRFLEILCRFVELCDASKIDEHDDGAINYKRIRKDILADIDSAVSELSDFAGTDESGKADRRIILFALNEIRAKIDGTYREENKKYFYLPFLQNEHVLLNENYLPELNDVEGLPEMSALACIERHFRSPQKALEVCAAEILDGEDDYGSLSLIRQYLEQHPGDDPAFVENLSSVADEGKSYAVKAFAQRKKDFEEYLELAQSYGQINSTVEDKKETMLQSAGIWYEYAGETENYGFFSKVTEAYKSKISEDAKVRAVELEKNLNAFKEANVDWSSDPAVKEAVEKLEERIRFQNYSAAEDLLNRLQAHDLEEYIPAFSKDYLEDFLREYNDTARTACTTGTFKVPLSERTKEGKHGSALLRAWPQGFGSSDSNSIKSLLSELGFNNPRVGKPERIGGMECFDVSLEKPNNGRKSNYTHPISIFGSEAEDNCFRVACAFGRRKPEELIDSFKSIGSAKNTLMFLNYSLTLPERRTLARLSKKEFTRKTFVVVDRVVITYLAKNYSLTAINRMLMSVVVPFAYYQPYVAESSKVMPPEMFMGRKTELEKIEAADGVNIVYGGRQLGKSALLRMAQKDIDRNENNDRAILVDIKGLDFRETARKIAAELADQHILDAEIPDNKADDWTELGRAVKKVLRDGGKEGKIPYFLLLLDEADAFIESCAEINYMPFDVLKDIQSVGTGRFKFVVSGLRNVVRFNRDAALGNNSVLTHLSSLTVTPFKASDARELLQVPLHYLGFRFQDDSKTDMLISNIFGTTNYFPGLLQLYCTKLIEAMRHDYAGYNEADTPPYLIREEHIKKVLADKTLEDQIREKFEITLKVDDDDYYYQIALLVAFHYHNMKPQSGCSPQSLWAIANDYGLRKISALSVEEIRALMEELRELNVLQKVGNGSYRFTRLSFCEMMGLPGDIDDKIIAYSTEE